MTARPSEWLKGHPPTAPCHTEVFAKCKEDFVITFSTTRSVPRLFRQDIGKGIEFSEENAILNGMDKFLLTKPRYWFLSCKITTLDREYLVGHKDVYL